MKGAVKNGAVQEPTMLKRCPFDGGEARYGDGTMKLPYRVYCCRCGATTQTYALLTLAESSWNKRTT